MLSPVGVRDIPFQKIPPQIFSEINILSYSRRYRFAIEIFWQRIKLVRRIQIEYLHLWTGRHSCLRHWRGARKHQG